MVGYEKLILVDQISDYPLICFLKKTLNLNSKLEKLNIVDSVHSIPSRMDKVKANRRTIFF